MADRYFRKILKRNWKTLVIIVICIFAASFIIKNIGEMPYENRHMRTSTLTLNFKYKGKDVRGFVYASYWVRTKDETENKLSPDELDDYLTKNGYLDLSDLQGKIISSLKSYSLEEIREDWYDDYEYFKTRNIYFIENDKKLEKVIENSDLNLDLPFELKKVFFVYMDRSSFAEYMKNRESDNEINKSTQDNSD